MSETRRRTHELSVAEMTADELRREAARLQGLRQDHAAGILRLDRGTPEREEAEAECRKLGERLRAVNARLRATKGTCR